MKKKRLIILADFLDTVRVIKFDLGSWRDGQEGESRKDLNENLLDETCGAKGCAIGYACAIPEFIEKGLSYDRTPCYKGLKSWDAVGKFFDIDEDVSMKLFARSQYSPYACGPKDVAANIRAYVQKKE